MAKAASRGKSSPKTPRAETNSFLEKLFTLSGDMICIADIDGYLKKINPAFEKHLGYTSAELLNKPFLDFVHPDDVQSTKAVIRSKLEQGLPVFNFENRYRCKDGTYKWLSWTSNPIVAENLVYAIARDVTESKTAEQKLKDSEKRYQQLFELESDAIFLIDIETGRFIEANKAASDLYGYSHDELMTKRHVDLSAEPEATIRTVANPPKTIPLRYHRKKDGTVFPVEITTNRYVDGERKVLLCAVRDITGRMQAEEARKKSENKYRTLFSEMQSGFSLNEIICDEKGVPVDYVTLEVNRAFESLLGQSREAVLNQKVSNFLSKSELDHWLGIFGPVAMTGKSDSYEMYSPYNDKYFEGITYSPERGKFAVVFRDVTEHKKAEDALKELAKKEAQAAREWQETFDCANDIICLISKDFEFLRINKKGLEEIGKPQEEVIGKKCYEVVHGLHEPIAGCPCIDTLKTKKPGHGEVCDHGLYFRTSASPIFDKDGKITAFVHTISNVNEQKKAEVELEAAHEDLEIAQRLTGIGSWKWTIATNKVTWSKGLCYILGWDPQKAPPPFNEEMASFYSPDSWNKLNEVVAKALSTGEPYDIETTEIKTDGTRIITNTRGEPDYSPDGKIVGLHGTVQDITERKHLQEQLIAQDRLVSIGQLVSGIAHELNNPLTSVIGFSELLLRSDLPAEVKADIEIICSEANRTATIVKNLLTFARQQSKDKQVIDINTPVLAVLRMRERQQKVNNIKVETRLTVGLAQVLANTSQLQQVFFNVIINAEQAMLSAHRKGVLSIVSERRGNFVRVSFTDDGPGITREHMARLFSPFFTTKEPGQGIGLGLSISQGIIAEHGGKMWAESTPGKGATFFVELPVYESP